MAPAALELRGIVRRFGSVQALRGADFVLAPGEVHALLGENGAGKTTLMHIAYGMIRPEAGTIRVGGSTVAIRSPREARALGIGMVHQHFTSVPALSVEENVRLAAGTLAPPGKQAGAILGNLDRRLWKGLDPESRVEDLSVALKQRLEILKALAANARILLLDEPTAVLAPSEIEELLRAIKGFAAAGGAVVLISHKLGEVLAGADRVTVLRRGATVYSGDLGGDAVRERLTAAMLGQGEVASGPAVAGAEGAGDVAVLASDLRVAPRDGRGPGVVHASFEVRTGEILGVAAIEGNGHRELLLALAGLLPAAGGRLEVARPLAFVPEDRSTEGLIPELTLAENVALEFGKEAEWVRRGWLDWPRARRFTAELLREHAVDAPGPNAAAATLSGGNQQKLIMGRALARRPRVLIAENPARGLDIRAAAAVTARLRAAAAMGAAVVLYSSDLDEVLTLADRFLVMHAGRARPAPDGAGREAIGRMLLGESTARGS